MKMCPPISPLPFQPPFPRAPVSLAAHVSDTSDPHRTLDLVPTLSKGSGEPSAPGAHAGDVYVDSSSGGLWSWDGASWSRILAGRPVKTSDLVNDGDGQSPFARRSDLVELVGGAPAAFDTLKEVAEWIEDDQSGAAAMAAQIAALESGKADSADLATVATSGSYNDLTDKPTIPAPVAVDSALSDTSTNPVQNKAVKAAVDAKCTVAEAVAEVTRVRGWEWTNSEGAIQVNSMGELPSGDDGNLYYSLTGAPSYEDGAWDMSGGLLETYSWDGASWEPHGFGWTAQGAEDAGTLVFSSTAAVGSTWGTFTARKRNVHGLARLADLPTKTSDLTNDSGFLTGSQGLDASAVTTGTLDAGRLPAQSFTFSVSENLTISDEFLITIEVVAGDYSAGVQSFSHNNSVSVVKEHLPRTDSATAVLVAAQGYTNGEPCNVTFRVDGSLRSFVLYRSPIGMLGLSGFATLTANRTLELVSIAGTAEPGDCLLEGTRILLADGTERAVEDVGYGDELAVWDFGAGRRAAAKPLWVRRRRCRGWWFENVFSDGTVLRTTGRSATGWGHRGFNLTRGAFTYFPASVGDMFLKADGSVARLVSSTYRESPVWYRNIITDGHMNCYANGVLTSCRLNNYRGFRPMDVRFRDPAKACHAREEFDGLPGGYIDGLHLCENPAPAAELVGYVKSLLARAADRTEGGCNG